MSDQTIPDGLYGHSLIIDGKMVWVYVPPSLPLATVAEAIWEFWGEGDE